jgi:hypothetical protein
LYVLAQRNIVTGYISASSITDIFYIAQKEQGKAIAKEALRRLLKVFRPAAVKSEDIYRALALEWEDFEDSVQFVVGTNMSVDFIVTRNADDFSTGYIDAITPEQFLRFLTDGEDAFI